MLTIGRRLRAGMSGSAGRTDRPAKESDDNNPNALAGHHPGIHHEPKHIIDSFRDTASLLVPGVPLLELTTLPPVLVGERRRPSFPRRLDGASLDQAFAEVRNVVEPVHDLALSVFQTWLDHLVDQACPLYEDNKRFTTMLYEMTEQYGFRLYVERHDELVQVRIDTKPARASLQTNPTGPTAQSGLFTLRSYDPARKSSVGIADLALFPRCIAARNLEQANQIRESRKRGAVDASTPED